MAAIAGASARHSHSTSGDVTESVSIRAILTHLGKPTTPPVLGPHAGDRPDLAAGFAFNQSP